MDDGVLSKEELCALILRQLRSYGFEKSATVLDEESKLNVNEKSKGNGDTMEQKEANEKEKRENKGNDLSSAVDSPPLDRLAYLGKLIYETPVQDTSFIPKDEEMEVDKKLNKEGDNSQGTTTGSGVGVGAGGEDDTLKGSNSALNLNSNLPTSSTSAPKYVTLFTTIHKMSVRTVAFSPEGKLVATGSADNSLKVLEVSKMSAKDPGDEKPVIRTLYDHAAPINDVCFHPNGLILASCAKDSFIKLFDLTKAATKHSFRFFKHQQDPFNVRSISFHPSGDFIIAGTDHEAIRLYDVNTFGCYTGANIADNHRSAINQVNFAPEGQYYVSAGKDGSVKIWDTVTSRVVRNFEGAHSGCEVSCARFSKNSKYLLTSGKDSITRLWDVGTGRLVKSFEGATHKQFRLQAVFNSSEDRILSTDEVSNHIVVWDATTGQIVERLHGHTSVVRALASSPTESCLMSGSDDHRARFWKIE